MKEPLSYEPFFMATYFCPIRSGISTATEYDLFFQGIIMNRFFLRLPISNVVFFIAIKRMSKPFFLLLATVCCIISGQALAKTTTATQCTSERSPSERLACFDRLHNTPLDTYTYVGQPPESSTLPAESTLTSLIIKQESTRVEKDIGLLSSTSLEYANAEQERVIISVPALAAVGVRPLLSTSCSDNITRLQIIFPKPISAHRVSMTLRNSQKKTISSYPWRVSEKGYVLDAGRGIPSIQLLQRLLTTKRLYIESDEPAIDGVHFDIGQLEQHIKPLQRACNWQAGVANRG